MTTSAQNGLCLTGRLKEGELTFALVRGANLVGSHQANRICLHHDGVSRHHALLVLESERVEVVDQGSKNGTFVNGYRIRQAEVWPGDRVAFGPVELALEEVDPADLELALDLDVRASPALGGDTTTGVLPCRAERWLRLVERFVDRLVAAGPGGASPALAAMMEALEAAGACLAEVCVEEGLVVLGACGEVNAGRLEADVLDWKKDPGEAPFRSDRQGTSLVASTSRGPLILHLSGDFPDRTAVGPLLSTVLALFDHLVPGTSGGGREADPIADLCFPAGYVAGVSAAMTAFHGQLRLLARSELPLLIQGETGTGKEMVARTLHLSSRRRGPFVAINCAAIPAELIEADLFGIRRGVATGVEGRPGRFQEACGGTLFLDEIGEIPPPLQAKLLRALQEKEITPVGGSPRPMDARVLAATNADLGNLIEAGTFRRDLFYRLAGFVLRVPPLRARAGDVPLMVDRMLRTFSAEASKPLRGMTVAALHTLSLYSWPGNVRELEHEVRRLVTLCPAGQAIKAAAISEQIRQGVAGSEVGAGVEVGTGVERIPAPVPEGPLPTLKLADLETLALRSALERSGGNRAEAARLLGISRYSLLRRLRRLDP